MDEQGSVVRFEPGETAGKIASGEMRIERSTQADAEKAKVEQRAREIMGDSFSGVEEVEQALRIAVPREMVPQIPFSEEELERALELGQRLIFRPSYSEEDRKRVPITIDWLIKHCQAIGMHEPIDPFVIPLNSLENDRFYTSEAPDTRWSLVTSWLIPLTSGANYVEQTRKIVSYLNHEVFEDMQVPQEFRDATEEFRTLDEVDGSFDRASKHNNPQLHQLASLTLANLDITKLTRPKAVDILFDKVVSDALQGGGRPSTLDSDYTFTASRTDNNSHVSIGRFDDRGGIISSGGCFDSLHKLGAVFSRHI